MSKVLLDTDILSEILKGKSAVVTARAGKYLAQQGCVTTSAITVAEIVYGFRRVGREDRVTQFEASLDTAEVLALDDAAARLAGRINADLERNVAHFEQVRLVGYDLYIDNWRKT
jgi:predicted nucleic acid-binding protein